MQTGKIGSINFATTNNSMGLSRTVQRTQTCTAGSDNNGVDVISFCQNVSSN